MKNKTLIIYNLNGITCRTMLPVWDIKEIHLYNPNNGGEVCVTDMKDHVYRYNSADIFHAATLEDTDFNIQWGGVWWVTRRMPGIGWKTSKNRRRVRNSCGF